MTFDTNNGFPEQELSAHFLEVHTRKDVNLPEAIRELIINDTALMTVFFNPEIAARYEHHLHFSRLDKKELLSLCGTVDALQIDSIVHDSHISRSPFCELTEDHHATILSPTIYDEHNIRYRKGIIISVNDTPIGYMKCKGIRSFIATQNVVNTDDKPILIKGGMYTLESQIKRLPYSKATARGKWGLQNVSELRVYPGRMIIPYFFEDAYKQNTDDTKSLYLLFDDIDVAARKAIRQKMTSDAVRYGQIK